MFVLGLLCGFGFGFLGGVGGSVFPPSLSCSRTSVKVSKKLGRNMNGTADTKLATSSRLKKVVALSLRWLDISLLVKGGE